MVQINIRETIGMNPEFEKMPAGQQSAQLKGMKSVAPDIHGLQNPLVHRLFCAVGKNIQGSQGPDPGPDTIELQFKIHF
jgi:hypothetical protein